MTKNRLWASDSGNPCGGHVVFRGIHQEAGRFMAY